MPVKKIGKQWQKYATNDEIILPNINHLQTHIDRLEVYTQKTVIDTYTLEDTYNLLFCGTKGSDYTVTLHTAVGYLGKRIIIKRTGTDNITIDGSGAETIDGSADFTLTVQYQTLTIVSDGSNWHIL